MFRAMRLLLSSSAKQNRAAVAGGSSSSSSRFVVSQYLSSTSSNSQRLAGKVAVITGAASGIGRVTAAEFIRNDAKVVLADNLEQLIQCLESQKRRRLYGDAPPARPVTESGAPPPSMHEPPPPQQQEAPPPPFYPPISLPPFPASSATRHVGAATKTLGPLDSGLREEVAENKSRGHVLGADAMIKVLSRRRPEQLIKTIAALEDMHMSILHTNITTIEQTVLYSNVKIAGEPRFSADDITGAVHQIVSFIDVNYTL